MSCFNCLGTKRDTFTPNRGTNSYFKIHTTFDGHVGHVPGLWFFFSFPFKLHLFILFLVAL